MTDIPEVSENTSFGEIYTAYSSGDIELTTLVFWATLRNEKYRDSCASYAKIALAANGGDGKHGSTVAASDWEATIATDGFTKSYPLEAALVNIIIAGASREV